jgi:alkanesulfonate monooxygenase SsuD/methylene tetrahydromethanopterin reductase-like flavin-dependent oxidoreductase (luciferase family)
MKFAHFSHVWGKPNMTAHQRYEQLWRELQLCDELGFDYSFCVEHHFRPDESWMSSPALYAVAGGARTKRLRVGAMGFVVPLHNPLASPKRSPSSTRCWAGVSSAASFPASARLFHPFGIDYNFPQIADLRVRALPARRLWRQAAVRLPRRNHNTDSALLAVQPVQKPHPPLWMMSRDPPTLEFCAKEGVNTGYFISFPRHEAGPRYQKFLAEWNAAGHPRKPNIAYSTVVYVDETDQKALDTASVRASRAYEGLLPLAAPGETFEDRLKKQKARLRGARRARRRQDHVEHLRSGLHHGQRAGFRRLGRDRDEEAPQGAEIGFFNTFMGEFNFADLPEADLMRSIRLFGEKVMPALRDYEPF